MIVEASVTGLFKTLLIIIGAFVVIRFFGQLMIAKRNMEEERQMNKRQNKLNKERNEKLRNFGKTKIVTENRISKGKVEDVDFEEVE